MIINEKIDWELIDLQTLSAHVNWNGYPYKFIADPSIATELIQDIEDLESEGKNKDEDGYEFASVSGNLIELSDPMGRYYFEKALKLITKLHKDRILNNSCYCDTHY